jgi:hypothetical protein
MPTHSEVLSFKLDLTSDAYGRLTRRLWRHPKLAERFAEVLIQLYGTVRAGVPLMQAALDRCRALPGDPVATGLIEYFEHHIPEEKDHDEWLLQDIVDLGVPREVALGEIPSPLIASVVGAQYYWIYHQHPVALMGWLFLLEGNPPQADHLAWVQARTGLPDPAFRTLRHHAEADIEHRQELLDMLDRLPLTPAQEGLLGVSAMWSQHLLGRSLAELLELFEEDPPRRTGQQPKVVRRMETPARGRRGIKAGLAR